MEVIMSSPVQNRSWMEYDRGDGAAKLSRSQKRNRKLLEKKSHASLGSFDKREDTENPESKREVPRRNVDIITQSPIQDNPNTGLGTTATAAKLSRSQKGKRKLLEKGSHASLESFDKREDAESPESKREVPRRNVDVITQSSIQDNPNTGLGTTATATKPSRSQKKKRKLLEKKSHASFKSFNKREDTENPEGKPEVPRRNFYIITQSSIQDNLNTGLRTAAAVDQKRAVSSAAATGDGKSSISKREGCMEIAKGEMGSSRTTTVDVKTESKREEYMEIANDMRGSSRKATLDVKASSIREEQTEIANGEMCCSSVIGTRDAKNTMSSREQHVKIAIGETVTSGTAIIDANTGSEREKDMETASGETFSGKIATLGAKLVSKGEEHTKVANGDIALSTTKNLNVNGTVQKRKKKKSKKGKPTSGEILNPRYLMDMESANGEADSGTTATNNPASKKRKRQKLENKNPASGDILSTRESTQDMVIEKKGSSTTKVLEAMCGESVSGKTATPDAKIVSKGEEHTKVANGEMGSSRTKNLNVNDTVKKRKKKSKKRKPTLGEILNPRCLQDKETANGKTGSGTTVTDNTASKKRNRGQGNRCDNTEGKAVDVITHVATSGKKLLIFDVNGVLADIVFRPPKDFKADKIVPKRAIFKRPFLEDFLCFCFERFNVGIWSSRSKQILHPVVNYLLGDLKKKLIFLWDASSCTNSGVRTLEDKHKCIVFKDLRKIWEKNGPGGSWVKGTFDESNTLLLDDSPYKALLNPKHTGIFPVSYSYKNTNDNFLGPNGDLRTYLEGVAATDNLKMYVEQHPFGQGAIDETSPHWAFYSRLLKGRK